MPRARWERLDPKRFLRVHRAHIVNLDHVRSFKRDVGGNLEAELRDGTRIPVAVLARRCCEAWGCKGPSNNQTGGAVDQDIEQRVTLLRRPLLIGLTVLVATTANSSVGAQQRTGALPPTFASDSVAWERILVYVVGQLSTHLVRTANDTARQPWRIALPADAPQRPLRERQLHTILRTRPTLSRDTVAYELEIGSLIVVNDTGRVVVRTDFARRCPGTSSSGGFENIDRVYVVRHPPGFWSIARSEGVRHGDRFGCAR
jgi:hypothetical protein